MNNDPVKDLLKLIGENPGVSNDALLKKFPYLKPEKLTRVRAYALGYNSGDYEEDDLNENFKDVLTLFPSEKKSVSDIGAAAGSVPGKQQTVRSVLQGAKKIAGNIFGTQPTVSKEATEQSLESTNQPYGLSAEGTNSYLDIPGMEELIEQNKDEGKIRIPGEAKDQILKQKWDQRFGKGQLVTKAQEKETFELFADEEDPLRVVQSKVQLPLKLPGKIQNTELQEKVDAGMANATELKEYYRLLNMRPENREEAKKVKESLKQQDFMRHEYKKQFNDVPQHEIQGYLNGLLQKRKPGADIAGMTTEDARHLLRDNATANVALDVFDANRRFNDVMQGAKSIEEAAIKNLRFVDKETYKRVHLATEVPPSLEGYALHLFLSDPTTQKWAGKTPEAEKIYNDAFKKLFTEYSAYGKKMIGETLASERQKRNADGVLVTLLDDSYDTETVTKNDQLFQELVAEGKLPKEAMPLYQQMRGDLKSYIPTTDLTRSTIRGMKRGVGNIVGLFTDIVTSGDEATYGKLEKDFSTPQVQGKGVNAVTQFTGEFTGEMIPLMLLTKNLMGARVLGRTLSAKEASAIATGMFFEHPNRERASELYPNDTLSQNLYTLASTSIDVLVGSLYNRSKPLEGLVARTKQSFSEAINGLRSGAIGETAYKEAMETTLKTFTQKAKDFGANFLKNNTEQATHLAGFTAAHNLFDAAIGEDNFRPEDTVESFKHAFLSGGLLSGFAAVGARRKVNYGSFELHDMAKNPEPYRDAIKRDPALNDAEKSELYTNLDNASSLLKELRESGLNESQQRRYLLHSMNEFILDSKTKETTDSVLKDKYKKEMEVSRKIREDILEEPIAPSSQPITVPEATTPVLESVLRPETTKEPSKEVEAENKPQNAPETVIETGVKAESVTNPVFEVKAPEAIVNSTAEITPRREPYVTQNGKYTVSYESGKRIVRDAEGVEPSAKTAKRYLEEHAETLNYSGGKTTKKKVEAGELKTPSFNSEREANRWTVENSDSPAEIAEVFLQTPRETVSLNSKELLIAEYGIGKIKESSYREFGDGNNLNNAKARTYINNEEGRSLDVIAKEISDHAGTEVTPQDLVDFIDRFPSGEYQAGKVRETEVHSTAKTRFEELTGVALNEDAANRAILQKADREMVERFGRAVDTEPMPEAELKKWLEQEIELLQSENNNTLDYGSSENRTADQLQSRTESAVGENSREQATTVPEEVLQQGRREETLGSEQGSPESSPEISDTPLQKETAQRIAEKLRQWAEMIEGDKTALKSDLLALPKAVVSTLLKGAAEIIEAGGTVKKAFDHVVVKVKEYYQENGIDKEGREVRAEVKDLFLKTGILETPSEKTVKQRINAATDARVKNKVVMSELSAIKKQIEDFTRGVKAGVKEGKIEGRIEGAKKGIEIGARQGLQEGYDIAQKEMQKRNGIKDALHDKVSSLLNIAVREGVFAKEVKSSVLQAALRKLNAAKTPSQLLRFVEYLDKVLDNVEYDRDLQTGNSLRVNIKSALKNKEKNADTRAVIREFSDIKPESVEDIKAYNELAEKVLGIVRGVKVSGGLEGVKVKNDVFEVENSVIQDYVDKHWEYREAESKRLLSEQYEDLVNMGVLDQSAMSLSEMRELIEAINGTEDAMLKAAEKFAGSEARLDALRKVVEYNHIGLKEYETSRGGFTAEELKVLKNLRTIDFQKLDAPQLAKLNDVINNIVTNDSFTGSGEIAVIAEVQRDTKVLADKINASPVKDLGSINNVFLQGFASNNLLAEFIYKSSKVAAEVQRLTGIADIFNGHARAKLTQDAAVREYLKLKKEVGGKDDALNRFRRGVFADVTNHFGGSESDIQIEFNRRKRWIEQTAERLRSSDVKEEQRECEFIQRVYDEILEGSNSANDVKAKMMRIAPANVKLVEFWRKRFADRQSLTRESAEIYNNRVWGGVENYTATKLKGVHSGAGVKEVGDMFDSIFINQSISNKVAGSKNEKSRAKELPKDSVLDLDFDNVQSRAFYEANLDVESTRAVLKAKHFLKQPEAVKLFGNSRNRKIIIESVRRSIALQRGTTMPLDAFEKAAYKTVNIVRAKGVRVALGSVFQLLKQYPSVAISTLGNLGTDAPLFLKALTVSNKLPLFERFNIGLRGETKAGFNKEVDLGVIDRAELGNATQKAIHLMEDVGHKLSDIALATLTKSDVSIARTSWLAYYMKDLRRQGVDIERIDWQKEHLNANDEAAAYAEQMVSRSQNANDATSMPNFFKEQKGIKGIVTSMILPFSTFSVNQRIRMTNDVQKILFGGEKKEAIKSLAATTAEIAAFNAIKVFAIGALTTAGARSLAQVFEMWDEDDEKAVNNKSEVTLNDSITISDKTKKWLANSVSDFFFSGLGSAPQHGSQQGMNWLYENAVTETYKDGKENKYPSLFFTKRKGETDWSSWGVLGIPLEQGYDAYRSADRIIFGAEHHTKDGVHRDAMSDNEQKLFTLAFLIDALSVVGVGDAELNNANRKLKSIVEKKMEKKYGGNEFTLITKGFGKNVEEGEVNFKKLSSLDQVRAWQVASEEQKKAWAQDIHDIDVLEEAEKKEENSEFFEDASNAKAMKEMKLLRRRTFKRFY